MYLATIGMRLTSCYPDRPLQGTSAHHSNLLVIHGILWLVMQHGPRSELPILLFLDLQRLSERATKRRPETTGTARLLPPPVHERQKEE
jgi:hypothetical protein